MATSALAVIGQHAGVFLRGLDDTWTPGRIVRVHERRGHRVQDVSTLDLDAFVARDYGRVVAAVGMITGNRQDAADAVQDALVGLLARPPRQAIDNLAAWVTVVASRRARDRHRSRMAESRALAKVGAPPEGVDDRIELLDVDLQRALDALPDQQRRICALHYLADQSVDSIAAALGISSGTVKTHLFRARQSLAAALSEEVTA